MASTKKSPDFEQRLAQLESLVTKMEQGTLNLEESLKAFEKGIAITRECQQALKHAEQKVEILTKQNGDTFNTESFEAEE